MISYEEHIPDVEFCFFFDLDIRSSFFVFHKMSVEPSAINELKLPMVIANILKRQNNIMEKLFIITFIHFFIAHFPNLILRNYKI